jgi:hypothetical protein
LLIQFFLLVREQKYEEAYRLGTAYLEYNENASIHKFCEFIESNRIERKDSFIQSKRWFRKNSSILMRRVLKKLLKKTHRRIEALSFRRLLHLARAALLTQLLPSSLQVPLSHPLAKKTLLNASPTPGIITVEIRTAQIEKNIDYLCFGCFIINLIVWLYQ